MINCNYCDKKFKRSVKHINLNKKLDYGKVGFWANKKRPDHSTAMSEKNNPNWQGGITSENARIRNSPLNRWVAND